MAAGKRQHQASGSSKQVVVAYKRFDQARDGSKQAIAVRKL